MNTKKKELKVATTKPAKSTEKPIVTRAGRGALRASNNKEYEKIMEQIDALIKIPDYQLTQKQADELHKLAVAAQRYEKSIYNIKPPSTFEGVLEMKMYELKLNHGEMAKKLRVSNAKFSLIMSGKQKPDIYFLKTMNEDLGVDGNYLLSVI